MADKTNNEENTVVQAIGKSIKSSPRKANVTLSLIRGLRVDKAINNLVFCRKRISNEILKILKSAISNAENNHHSSRIPTQAFFFLQQGLIFSRKN